MKAIVKKSAKKHFSFIPMVKRLDATTTVLLEVVLG
jgi:hypothetical protein